MRLFVAKSAPYTVVPAYLSMAFGCLAELESRYCNQTENNRLNHASSKKNGRGSCVKVQRHYFEPHPERREFTRPASFFEVAILFFIA